MCLRLLTCLWIIWGISFSSALYGNPLSLATETQINQLLQAKIPTATVGVVVQDVVTGEVIYDFNGHKLLVPASTAKVLTSTGALFKLGPHYTFKTYLKTQQLANNKGILKGPVAIEFTGDPSLSSLAFNQLLSHLSEKGVKEIRDDILIDTHRFNGPEYAQGWVWNSMPWYYSPPITAAIMNENRLKLQLIPSQTLGKPVSVRLFDEDKPFYSIKASDVKTVTWQESEANCQIEIKMDTSNQIDASGCWPVGEEAVTLHLAVQNPIHTIKLMIEKNLKEQGIKHKGQIRLASKEDDLSGLLLVAKHESKVLSQLLSKILEDSNNLYTEALFKTLGSTIYGQGSFQTGALSLKQILKQELSINMDEMVLVDGSGLSRYNLVSPHHLTRALYVIHHNPELSPYLKEALAVSGEKDTLKKRMQSFDLKNKISGKTGSMSHVSAFSGFIQRENDKHTLAITVMINGAIESSQVLKQVEEDICRMISNDQGIY